MCCDGLTGFAEAIEATWTQTTVQTCVVHLIRAAMRFVSYSDRKAVAAALKSIYRAVDATTARAALEEFKTSQLGIKYPNTVATFEKAWATFLSLAFLLELRRVIYTTNAIESLNYQLRMIKNRGHFPNDNAVVQPPGWRSAPSRTNAPENARRNADAPPTSAKPLAGWSRDRSPPTGNKRSPSSPWPTPSASSLTYEHRPTAYTEILTSSWPRSGWSPRAPARAPATTAPATPDGCAGLRTGCAPRSPTTS